MESLIVLIVLFSFLFITTAIQVIQRRKEYKRDYELDREVYRTNRKER